MHKLRNFIYIEYGFWRLWNKNREDKDHINPYDVRKILRKVESDFGGRSLSRNIEEQEEK